jgi:hypothetical protein
MYLFVFECAEFYATACQKRKLRKAVATRGHSNNQGGLTSASTGTEYSQAWPPSSELPGCVKVVRCEETAAMESASSGVNN